MKKIAFLAAMALTAAGMAAEDFRMFNVVPYAYGKEAAMAERMKAYRAKTGNRDVLYSLSLHAEGVPAMGKADQLIQSFHDFKQSLAGTDLRVGVLIQSILGHWPRVDKEIEPWQRSINVKGQPVRFCILDPGFQNYVYEVGRKIALEKPAFIMGDDDIRAMCPEIECFCPLHVAELNRRLGTHYTQAELQKLVTEGKMGDKVYDAFMKLSNEIPVMTVTVLRKGIDSVDPSIPTSTCLAGRGQGMLETCRAFAGKHPMMIRITNQMYCEVCPRDDFGYVILRTMGQRAQYAEIPFVLDEADTCPHSLYSRSAVGMHAKLVSSIFCGLSGAKLWFVDGEKYGIVNSPRYSDILGKYQAFYQELARTVKETEPDGVIIPCFKRAYQLHAVNKPSEQRYPVSSWVNSQFGFFGIPFFGVMDYDLDRVYALGGEESIDRLNDEELKTLLSRRILVDGSAARALTRRGFGDLLGCHVVEKPIKVTREYAADGSVFALDGTKKPLLLEEVAPGAVALTKFYFAPLTTSKQMEFVAPGSIYFENALGGKVVTTSFVIDAYVFQRLEASRKAFLLRCLDKLSAEGRYPFILDDDQSEVLLMRRGKDGKVLLGIFNAGFDPLPEVRLRTGKAITSLEELRPDGKWAQVPVHQEGDVVVIPRSLGTYGTLVLRAK